MANCFKKNSSAKFHIRNLVGAQASLIAAHSIKKISNPQLFLFNDKEEAAYFMNDLETLANRKVLFYPSSYRRPYQLEETDNANVLLRTEVLNSFKHQNLPIIVSYAEAIFEKVISQEQLNNNTFDIKLSDKLSIDFLNECLQEYNFERVDFVIEPGQYSVRGGIVDVFSFSNESPFRIEFFDEEIESIRTFDINSQRSKEKQNQISIVPQFPVFSDKAKESILEFLPANSKIWLIDLEHTKNKLNQLFEKAKQYFINLKESPLKHSQPQHIFLNGDLFLEQLSNFTVVEFGQHHYFNAEDSYVFRSSPQPVFNKQFDLLIEDLEGAHNKGYQNFILCNGKEQINRFESIIEDYEKDVHFKPILLSLSQGFVDHQLKLCCYTDHQIFERYHKFHLKKSFADNQAISLQQLNSLQAGDYVTHIDHGIGRFAISRII